jgi:transposase
MIKSSKVTIKFANTAKKAMYQKIRKEYARVCQVFIDYLWSLDKVPKFVDKKLCEIDTWLSARMLQAAGKQASAIVKGTRSKNDRRLYMYNKLLADGETKGAEHLLEIINKTKLSKPELEEINPQLDSRFLKIDKDNTTSFDWWVTLSSIGQKIKLELPIKKHRHINSLLEKGKLLNSIVLGEDSITFVVELPDMKKTAGSSLGIDIGMNKLYTTSEGTVEQPDRHGHKLSSILTKINRKLSGSKNSNRTLKHRDYHIREAIKQINLSDV